MVPLHSQKLVTVMTVAEAIAKLSTLPQDVRMMDWYLDEPFEIKDYVYKDWGNPNNADRGVYAE